MSHTIRYNPDTHFKDAKERRSLLRKIEREQREKGHKESYLYQPDDKYELKGTDDDSE